MVSGNAWAIAAERRRTVRRRRTGWRVWKGHGQEGDRLTKALDLSKEQSEQVKAIFLKHRDATAPLRREMVSERRELRKLIQSDKLDEAAIREQVKKIAAADGDSPFAGPGCPRKSGRY